MLIGSKMTSAESRIEELRFHIGAHKTATTHFQDTLNANRTKLENNGWLYLSRRFVRQSSLISKVHHNFWQVTKSWQRQLSLGEILQLPEEQPKKLLLSEEDSIGMSRNLLKGLYPRAKERLLPWAAAANPEKVSIYISIRSQADVLGSAYSQALRDGAVLRSFEEYRSYWIDRKPSWSHLVKTAKALFPSSRITVWTFDKYVENSSEIIKLFCDLPAPDVDETISTETNRLSVGVIRKIEALDGSIARADRRQMIRDYISMDNSGERFDPLTGQEKKSLGEQYEKDLSEISRMDVKLVS
jgi:hypothetical protein